MTVLLACAAPAVAQEDPNLDPGGASADAPAATPTPTPTATPAPATTTSTTPVKTLKRGSRGAAVRTLQRKLKLRADGVYGKQTVRAVKRFQKRKGLRATGVANYDTQQALGLVTTAAKPASETDATVILERIAQCESGGDPTAVSRSGQYRGKYQFDRSTWTAMGGEGDPALAEEAEQDQRAAALYAQRGTKPWPVCGPKALSGETDTDAPVSDDS